MNIVKVQYWSGGFQETGGREYTYYSEDPLKVGDMVLVPVRDTVGKAKVSAIDVPETEIAAFKDKVKTIPAGSVGRFPEEKPYQIPEPTLILNKYDTPTGMAVICISPESDVTVLSLLAEANRLRDFAEARVIATDTDLDGAVNDLALIARVKSRLQEKKAEYYRPVKAHLDAITASFQTLLTPIEDADKITRGKWTAYRNEQKMRKAEADKLNQDAEDLARRQAAFNGTGEVTVDLTPVVAPLPVAKVRTDLGSAQTVKTRKYRVVNFALLPDNYKLENSALLNKVTKAGIPEIPGVEFYFEEGLRVNMARERDFSRLSHVSPGMP